MVSVTKPDSRDSAGRFRPGVSGNPGGRKKLKLTAALESTVNPDELARKLYELALSGDMQAIKYIYDRIDGTPTQRVDIDQDVAVAIAVEFGLAPEQVRRDLAEQRKHVRAL